MNNLREGGRIILAHGEVTGHCHEVMTEAQSMPTEQEAQYFDGPEGRELIILAPCVLRHQEHGPIALSPDRQESYRQGDVLLLTTGPGTWRVIQQQQREPEGWQRVRD